MGETWLGVQRGAGGFEQRVCLKFIHESFRDTAEAGALFLREAAIAASLRHSNIVGVIDADVEAGYMALELVDGTDLRSLLRQLPERRLAPALVASIAIELCRALEYAHTRTRGQEFAGVVHRDLSPGNVLVSYAGEVKLADFGVAKVIRATGDVASAVRGKLSYMCPEQIAGKNADARSDLFSLGVLLYEVLSGVRPFDGQNDADTVRRILRGEYTPLRTRIELPSELASLADVIALLLQSDPEQRLQSATAVLDALTTCTPPATATFELARLAQNARPHETLMVHPGEAASASRSAPSQTSFANLGRQLRSPRGIVLGLVVVAVLASSGIVRLAASAVRGAPTAPALPRPIAPRPAPPPPAPAAIAAEPSAAPGPSPVAAPTAPAGAEPSAAPEPATAAPPVPSPPDAGPVMSPPITPTLGLEPATTTDLVTTRPGPLGAFRATTLKVGVFPSGRVWIDGQLRGAAPLSLQLPPGTYTVAAGIHGPLRTRTVVLDADEEQRVIFDLQSTEDDARSQ